MMMMIIIIIRIIIIIIIIIIVIIIIIISIMVKMRTVTKGIMARRIYFNFLIRSHVCNLIVMLSNNHTGELGGQVACGGVVVSSFELFMLLSADINNNFDII